MLTKKTKGQLKTFLGAIAFYDKFPHLHERCSKLYELLNPKRKMEMNGKRKSIQRNKELHFNRCVITISTR